MEGIVLDGDVTLPLTSRLLVQSLAGLDLYNSLPKINVKGVAQNF
jgi:hypothetical protein